MDHILYILHLNVGNVKKSKNYYIIICNDLFFLVSNLLFYLLIQFKFLFQFLWSNSISSIVSHPVIPLCNIGIINGRFKPAICHCLNKYYLVPDIIIAYFNDHLLPFPNTNNAHLDHILLFYPKLSAIGSPLFN